MADRLSQEAVEVVVQSDAPDAVVSQVAVEVLHTNTSGTAQAGISQVAVEVLVGSRVQFTVSTINATSSMSAAITKKDIFPKWDDLGPDFQKRWDAHEKGETAAAAPKPA